MGRDELTVGGRPGQLAHLGVSLGGGEASTSGGVPGSDSSVGCTSTRGKCVGLEGAPGEGLDGGSVVVEREEGGLSSVSVVDVPDVEHVVVATRGELAAIRGPLQSTDLLGVGSEDGHGVVGNTDIMVDDVGITASRGQDEVVVPGKGTNTGTVTIHGTDLLHSLNVPHLDNTAVSSDSKVVALLDPGDRGDGITLWQGQQTSGFRGGGVPDVNVIGNSNGHNVFIYQIVFYFKLYFVKIKFVFKILLFPQSSKLR